MNTNCKRCDLPIRRQAFYCDGFAYDIGKALDVLKRAPRGPIILPSVPLYASIRHVDITLKHAEHVSVRLPVIAIPYADGFKVIDGNHRAWRRLFRKLPVKAFLLTPEEVAEIRTLRG